MDKTFYIGVTGRARHGKNTFVEELHALMPRESKLYSFAAALKSFARVLGMTAKDAPLLQALGTDVFRRLNENIWVDIIKHQLEEEAPQYALLTDVRFVNEVDFIRSQGGIIIKIIRLNPDGSTYYSADRDKDHLSESCIDAIEADFVFKVKSGNKVEIEDAAKHIFGRLAYWNWK